VVARRARGAVFTPESAARHLLAAALDSVARPTSVCDPAAGDGRILRLLRQGLGDPPFCFGADLHRSRPADLVASWAVADTLALGAAAWPDAPPEGFDLVVGNPPFRNQLERETSLSAEERIAAAVALGPVTAGYADAAAMFLVRACEMAAPTGRVAFIMPLSYLAARASAASRRRVLELATLDGIWIAPRDVFPDADVQVCALILDRTGPRRRPVRRWVGEEWTPVDPVEVDSDELIEQATWSHLIASALGVPEVHLDAADTLGSLVRTTAGFREQFYGLAPLVREAPEADQPAHLAPLVTSGLIDPGSVSWGRRDARIAGSRWRRPVIDLRSLDAASSLGRWVADRRRPKLVVATQTRVIEAAPDPDGVMIPSTPVIAAHVDGDDLWRALAVLLAPPVTAWARTHLVGAALSVDAVKLSARQVAGLPLPSTRTTWDRAARVLSEAHHGGGIGHDALVEAGRLTTDAYQCGDDVLEWWWARLPTS
jgi:hypothetical protein